MNGERMRRAAVLRDFPLARAGLRRRAGPRDWSLLRSLIGLSGAARVAMESRLPPVCCEVLARGGAAVAVEEVRFGCRLVLTDHCRPTPVHHGRCERRTARVRTGSVGPGTVAYTVNGKSWTGSYPGAAPAVATRPERIYHLNAHGQLACLEATNGKSDWTVDVLQRFGGENITWALSENLLVDGQHVIVTPGGTRGLMAALDKTFGRNDLDNTCVAGRTNVAQFTRAVRIRGRRILASCSAAHGFAADADTGLCCGPCR